MTDSVTVIVPVVTTDSYGGRSYDYASGTRTSWSAFVEPIGVSENPEGRDQSVERIRVWLPPTVGNIFAHDRVEHAGVEYELVGSAMSYRNPRTQAFTHVACEAVKVSG
jgi:hypothetical protein